MLTSFVDDSGSHDTSASYVLSAFYTTPRHWAKILREWLGMVHRYGVTAFHATDCANGAKEFEGWSKLSPFLMTGSEAMHKHHSTLGPGERTPGNIMQINAIDFLEVESFGDVLVHQ